MFYILKDGMCIYFAPTVTSTNAWLKENNKTIYKIYQDAFKNVVLEVK